MNSVERQNHIEAVFSGVVTVNMALERNHRMANTPRTWSPLKGDVRDNSIALSYENNYFTDFFSGVSGDAVCLDYYLATGEELKKEKGVDTKYFAHKANILGIDIGGENRFSTLSAPLPKAPDVPINKTAERKSPEEVSLALSSIYAVARLQDKSPIYPHLRKRGMSDEEIAKSPFALSLSAEGQKDALKLLQEIDIYPIGIPGFFQDECGNVQIVKGQEKNLLIPIYDAKHRLLSFHLRHLTDKSPYWSFSSSRENLGCSPGSPTGFWGKLAGESSVILTEGALKGYLIHIWTGLPVFYVLGVNAQKHLASALLQAKKENVQNVIFAFDMDYETNPNVQKAVRQARKTVLQMGFRVKKTFVESGL